MKVNVIVIVLSCLLFDYGESEAPKYRLPTLVWPSNYTLTIRPYIDEGYFQGDVIINVYTNISVPSIWIHSSELNITTLRINRQNASFKEYTRYELIEIFHKDQAPIEAGEHRIRISYSGSLLDKIRGFIKAKFTDPERNVLSYLAVTDFQPTFARKAFPCFDEPAFKAKFQINVIVPNDTFIALSNMNEMEKPSHISDGILHKFQTTCVMSTYLVAFAMTSYSYGGNSNVRIFSHNATNESSAFSINSAINVMDYFNNYTGFPSVLSKIDFIEYDRRFTSATENWGLVTVRKGLITPSLKLYQTNQIFTVIAHELSHFWFGNLVTNQWWDDIWLQEGFAVFMSIKAESYIKKNDAMKSFSLVYLEDIYRLDYRNSSNAVVEFVDTPISIAKHFNDITYVKGATVLRMLEFVIGEEAFQKAIQKYLKTFAYKTATTQDFISIIETVDDNVYLRPFLESYIYQNHFPILEVHEDEKNNEYVVKQRKYPEGYRWTIPITYVTDLITPFQLVWFDKNKKTLRIPRGNETWIKFNYNRIGYYRVSYSQSLSKKLMNNSTIKHLESDDIEHLLSESIQLYQMDIASCDLALNYMNFLASVAKLPSTPIYVMMMDAIHRDEFQYYSLEAYNKLMTYLEAGFIQAGNVKMAKFIKNQKEQVVQYLNETLKHKPHIRSKAKECAAWLLSENFV